MKQKYTILRDDEKNELVIKEFAELDKEVLSFLCEETYQKEAIEAAIAEGKASVITALRTHNMYPPGLYADKIAESVMVLYNSEGKSEESLSADIFFNDFEFLTKNQPEPEPEPEPAEETEEEAEDIDDLLEDDIETDFDKAPINPINSPLKIAEDESLDVEEET